VVFRVAELCRKIHSIKFRLTNITEKSLGRKVWS
jgi:hypothetical protein